MKKFILTFSIFLTSVLATGGVVFAGTATSTNYKLFTGDSASKGYASSTNYKSYSVTGQGGPVGVTTSSNYKVQAGLVRRYQNITDADGDGCDDVKELGGDWHLGGQRDPNNPWDFGDVPTPAISASNPNPSKNKSITLSDVSAVLFYVGTSAGGGPNANGVDYDNDFNANGIPDGREYDRTPSTNPNEKWRSGPPNGAVTLQDVSIALAQVGTNCN